MVPSGRDPRRRRAELHETTRRRAWSATCSQAKELLSGCPRRRGFSLEGAENGQFDGEAKGFGSPLDPVGEGVLANTYRPGYHRGNDASQVWSRYAGGIDPTDVPSYVSHVTEDHPPGR